MLTAEQLLDIYEREVNRPGLVYMEPTADGWKPKRDGRFLTEAEYEEHLANEEYVRCLQSLWMDCHPAELLQQVSDALDRFNGEYRR